MCQGKSTCYSTFHELSEVSLYPSRYHTSNVGKWGSQQSPPFFVPASPQNKSGQVKGVCPHVLSPCLPPLVQLSQKPSGLRRSSVTLCSHQSWSIPGIREDSEMKEPVRKHDTGGQHSVLAPQELSPKDHHKAPCLGPW